MNRKSLIILVSVVSSLALGALETFSRNGIAGGFADIRGVWSGNGDHVQISENASGLKFVFHTGVKKGDYQVVRGKHDSPLLLGGESIEVQLLPDPGSGVYFHIGFNPAGDIYSARKRDTSWEPAGLKIKLDDWSKVTVELPFAALGVKRPAAGSVWKVNFCRTRAVKGVREHSSWSGISNFHDTARFGTLKFASPDVPQLIFGSQTATESQVRVVGKPNLLVEMQENGRKWQGRCTREGNWFFTAPADWELLPKGNGVRKFTVTDKKGRVLLERSAKSAFDNKEILALDRFTYSPADRLIRWRSILPGKKDFIISGPAGQKWSSAAAAGEVKIPEMPGRYVMTVNSSCGRMSRVFEVRELAPILRDCSGKWERKGNFLYCGGRMRFMLGGSQTPVVSMQYGNAFNLANIKAGKVPNALTIESMGGKRLRRAPDGTGYLFAGDENSVREFCRKSAGVLAGKPLQISRIAYEAQMKSWFTIGKKPVLQDSAKVYLNMYRELKKHAPEQLFSIQIDNQNHAARFAPACDVFEIAVKGSYQVDPMPGIAGDIRKIRQTVPDKVLLHWLGVTIPNNYCRNAEELRAELFLAFINGSAGALLHLGHGFLPKERTRLWSVISNTGVELDEMMEEFHKHAAVQVQEPDGFQAAVRDCGRYYLLVAVNCQNKAARMKLLLPDKRTFSASFTALEPRVFRLRK
ncbi:MAG: hypothetical protein IKA87_00230 [Lentisphaeria bacterium]|nr:hypothetical protein [Lentisphaeria bacterium]